MFHSQSAILPIVDEPSASELAALREQLTAMESQVAAGIDEVSHTWVWKDGTPRILGSARISQIFSLVNGGALTAGIVISVIGGSLESLGVALIVGGIFGFGAFIAQFWSVAAQREFLVFDEVTGPVERLYALHNQYVALRSA